MALIQSQVTNNILKYLRTALCEIGFPFTIAIEDCYRIVCVIGVQCSTVYWSLDCSSHVRIHVPYRMEKVSPEANLCGLSPSFGCVGHGDDSFLKFIQFSLANVWH